MKKIIAIIAFASPSVALAQSLAPITNINDVTNKALSIGNTVTYLLVALAVIFIVWNVVMYMIKAGDDGARKAAGLNVLWGIVGLFVIVSIWGLVNILTNSFKTVPTKQPIPNVGQGVDTGGIPANQFPGVR